MGVVTEGTKSIMSRDWATWMTMTQPFPTKLSIRIMAMGDVDEIRDIDYKDDHYYKKCIVL